MMTKRRTLKDEIRQTKAFAHAEAEVFLNLVRTTEALVTETNAFLRGYGLSMSQYNVLRILRGAGERGRSGRDIVERMVTRDSDMTRLLDGLERKELVRRARSVEDRRVVMAFITPAGLNLLGSIDDSMNDLHEDQLGHLGKMKLRRLSALLEEAREVRALLDGVDARFVSDDRPVNNPRPPKTREELERERRRILRHRAQVLGRQFFQDTVHRVDGFKNGFLHGRTP